MFTKMSKSRKVILSHLCGGESGLSVMV
jgi:hypothetical protein